jgi:hypothetical protein
MQSPLLQIMRKPPEPEAERCDVCAAPIGAEHDHLVNVHARALLCACRSCYLLFMHEGAGGGRFRAVPQRYLALSVSTARAEVEALDLPIGLAFFLRNAATGRIAAFYPGPAGATESELSLDAWDALVAALPPLSTLAVDVEAALLRRRDTEVEAYIVPIDVAYELVGRIRRSWRGINGGDDVRGEIDAFFARVADRARATAAAPLDVAGNALSASRTA